MSFRVGHYHVYIRVRAGRMLGINKLRHYVDFHLLKQLYYTIAPNTVKGVQNATRSGVFLTNLEVFGNVVNH